MLSGCILLKLPMEWQEKMRNEILSKIKLCITDYDTAISIANNTWQLLSQSNLNKHELSLRLEDYLNEYASDFSEWVIDFSQKSIEYFIESTQSDVTMNKTIRNGTNEVSSNNLQMSSTYIENSSNITDSIVDPLDEPLDNLVRKEKIAKLEGISNSIFGVQTKSGKFKVQQDKKHQTFYKNLTLNNETQPLKSLKSTTDVVKVPKICINFPNCTFGDQCRYVHPVHKLCKNFPNCTFGDKCAFIHPKEQ